VIEFLVFQKLLKGRPACELSCVRVWSTAEGVRESFELSEELSRMERFGAEVRNTRPVATERSGRERPKEKIYKVQN